MTKFENHIFALPHCCHKSEQVANMINMSSQITCQSAPAVIGPPEFFVSFCGDLKQQDHFHT